MKTIRTVLLFVVLSGGLMGIRAAPETEIDIEIVTEPERMDTASSIFDTLISTDDAPYDTLSPLEKEPVLKRFVEAVYPDELAGEGITGVVVLDVLVNENGTIDSVAVVKGLHQQLDSSVADAVRQFEFEPAVAGGQPVPVLLTYEYRVTLDAVIDNIRVYVNFSGTVLERGTRIPVSNAEVMLTVLDTTADTSLPVPFTLYMNKIGSFEGQSVAGTSVVTETDSNGIFSFRSLPAGSCKVTIPVVGYESFTSLETLGSGERLDVIYRIRKIHYSEYEIVVYGREEAREVARRTLTVSEVRKIPGFGGDAVKVVQALPGVARPVFGGGAVIVRGAPTWDSKFYLDGVAIPQLYHFGGIKSTYNSEALQSIDFYPGGFSSRYGGAVAGIVDLKGRRADRERPKGFGDVSLLDATVFMESPVGEKVSVLATARRSYIGNLLGFATEHLSFLDLPVTVAPYYYDFIIRSDVEIDKQQNAFLTLFGSKDELELIVPFLRRGSSEIDSLADRVKQLRVFTMGIGGWDIKSNSGWENHLRASMIYGKGNGSIFGLAKFDVRSREYTLRDEASYTVNDKMKLNLGVDLWWQHYIQDAVFPNPDNTFFPTTFDTDFGLAGPYCDIEIHPVPKLLIIPGIRYDYYHELKYDGSIVPEFWDYRSDRYRKGGAGEPSFRISSRYEITGKQTVKASVGTYNQTPQPQGFTISESVGNPLLPATRARHIVAGYEHAFTDLIFADIQVYHNRQWGIPVFASTADIIGNPDGPRILPDGKGRMYGLELLLRHDNSERFFGWIAYTLARSERFSAAENRYALFSRDQTHNLQLVASYRFLRQWEAGTRVRYVSGNPYTPIIGSSYNVTNRFYRPLYGSENSLRNDPFFQVDIRVDKKFVFDRWMFSVYLDIQNVLVFLYRSPEFTVNNFDYTEQTAISSPFIPSLGLRAEF